MRGHRGVRRHHAPCGIFTSHTGCLYSRMSSLILFHLRTCCMTPRIITRAYIGKIRLFLLVQADFEDRHAQIAYRRPPSSFWPLKCRGFTGWNESLSFPVQSHLFLSLIGARTLKMPIPYPPPNVGAYTRTFHNHPPVFGQEGHRSSPSGRLISSCPNYLHADVNDGEDLSRHQQEVTGGQLVTMSLVPGAVDSDVTLECHLCCPPPLPGQAEGALAPEPPRATRITLEPIRKICKKTFFFSHS